ncbi:hypothetical protein J4E89_005071 [Alternaria sp. Ai002NY15]|nr:hypothetical protein J4E89_005071 [Alternaria sp. Ai002NY15]
MFDLKGVQHEEPTTLRILEARSQRTLWLIESFVRLARISKEELAVDEKDLQSAMGFCTRAEQESSFPVLAEYTEKQKAAMHERPIDLKNARNMFVEAVVAAKIKAMELGEEDSNEAKCLPGWADIDETDTQSARFSQQMMIWLMETGPEKLALLAMTGSGSAHSEAHDQVNMSDVANDDVAEFIQEKEEEQERKDEQAAIASFIQEKKTDKTKKRTKHQITSIAFSDAVINTGALRKLRVIDKIMAALRTAKGAEVEIPPHVPQFGMVPYIPYTRFREMDAEAMRHEEEKQARGATEEDKAEEGDERPSKRPRLPEGAYAEDHGAVAGLAVTITQSPPEDLS